MKTTKPSIMECSYEPGREVDAFTAAGSNKSNHQSYPDMKNLFALLMIVILAICCSCQKHPTDEELQARIEREVKRQLAAEREIQEKELEQRRSELSARRNALLKRKGSRNEHTGARASTSPESSLDRGQIGKSGDSHFGNLSSSFGNVRRFGIAVLFAVA